MAQYRPRQRPSHASSAAPVRLLDRRGTSEPLVVATQSGPVSSRKKTPKNHHNSKVYTPKSARGEYIRLSPPPVPAPRPPMEDVQVLLERLNTWEKLLKNCSYSEDQDGAETRTALRGACVELINTYPKTAKRLHVNERLWKSWYREMDSQQSVLTKCSAFYSTLVDQLESSLRRPNLLADHRDGLKHSLQLSLVALGDVARYEQNQLEKGKHRDWTAARKYYQRALEVAPSNGKVYNQLGLLAVLEGKLVEGAYLYARSLVCESPFATAENLIHVLKRGKKAEKQQSSGTPSCKAFETYSESVLSCMYMILTGKAPKSVWDETLERMQTALVQLLNVCDQQNESVPIDGPLLEALSLELTQVVCLTIVLTHNFQHKIGEVSGRGMFDEAFENDAGSASTPKALAVGRVTITSLFSKITAVLSASAESTRTKYFANALLPALNIYLDWLHLHQALLSKLNPFAATIQDSCVKLFHTLSAKGFVERGLCCIRNRKRDGDLSGAVLPEDREINGFMPCMKALETRFPEEFTPENKLSQQLTEEERLVLRATRFMAASERYVFSGTPPVPAPSVPAISASKPRAPGGATAKTRNNAPQASRKSGKETNGDPFAVALVLSGCLCILCSNTSSFAGGVCEFCGYEDEDLDIETTSDDGDDCVNQPSWIQDYDVAYNNNDASPGRKSTSPGPPSQHRRSSASSSSSSPQPSSPLSPTDNLETDFKTIMSIGAEHSDFQDSLAAGQDQRRLIVIDAPNVAMRHGKGKLFSCAGIELAANYFQALGHRVVAFIPDYMLQSDEERALREEQGEVLTAAKIPDDGALLECLVQKGVLIPTPPQDYDDSYSIQYAGLHDGYVVTNDLFRDHIVNMVGPRERKVAMRAWLRAHQISYSWVRNEFLPNPNFRFPDAIGGAL